ncbi:MAG: PLP-dependent cysteine synthase family protein [Myxococcales bacterium]
MILDSLAQAVGNTPLVRLRSLEPKGVEIHAKLEWFNPGGSVKDRAALGIFQEALGTLNGRTLLDSTSGNTGIAYAWLGAAMKIPVALVMPDNVSEARKRIAKSFGAQVIFSDPLEQSDGAIRLARKLAQVEPDKWFYADQYSNEANPRAHELTTAPEIWQQTGGRVTDLVLGIGTGGTIMGTTRGLKARNPRLRSIAVEPAEALHGLEGLKHMPSSIVPRIYKEEELDRKLSIASDDGWDMAERLIRDEALLAGHSSGAAAVGAVRIARELSQRGENGVVVTLFPDRADRYLPPP